MLGDLIGGGIKKGGSSDPWLGSDSNTFLGVDAAGAGNLSHGSGTEGWNNTLIGYQAGYALTTGHSNVFVGMYAGDSQTTAAQNVAAGHQALASTTTAPRQVAVGYQALYLNDAGYSVGVGYRAGRNSTGSENVFVGSDTGYTVTTGYFLMYLGYRAGFSTTTGYSNVAIGRKALEFNTTGSGNVAIGASAGGSADVSNCTYIGQAAGQNNAMANRLFIDISNTGTPLIYGAFDGRFVIINDELRIAGDVGGQAAHNSFTGATDTPTADPGWSASSTTNMTAPDGYIKAYVGTQAVTIPYWNT